MPRQPKGPRLYRRKDRNGLYIIRDDDGRFQATGTRDRREAEIALARYITAKDRQTGPATPDQMTVAGALAIYGKERAPLVKDPERIGYCIAALVPILGDLTIASIAGEVCRPLRQGSGQGTRHCSQGTWRPASRNQLLPYRGISDRDAQGDGCLHGHPPATDG